MRRRLWLCGWTGCAASSRSPQHVYGKDQQNSFLGSVPTDMYTVVSSFVTLVVFKGLVHDVVLLNVWDTSAARSVCGRSWPGRVLGGCQHRDGCVSAGEVYTVSTACTGRPGEWRMLCDRSSSHM